MTYYKNVLREGLKRCPKCRKVKPVSEFYKNRSRKDCLTVECKSCCKKNVYKYRAAYPKKVREYQRVYMGTYLPEYIKYGAKKDREDSFIKQEEYVYAGIRELYRQARLA